MNSAEQRIYQQMTAICSKPLRGLPMWQQQNCVLLKKQLEQDLLHAIEMEQKRIGQDLHDSLGQQLLAVSFLCNVLKKKLAAGTMPAPIIAETALLA